MGQDSFDAFIAHYKNSDSYYEEMDGTHRTWQELSPEGKLSYLTRDAVLDDVPFECFVEAARDFLGELPAAEREKAALQLLLLNERELHGAEKLLPSEDTGHDLLASRRPLPERLKEFLDDLAQGSRMERGARLEGYGRSEQPAPAKGQRPSPGMTLSDAIESDFSFLRALADEINIRMTLYLVNAEKDPAAALTYDQHYRVVERLNDAAETNLQRALGELNLAKQEMLKLANAIGNPDADQIGYRPIWGRGEEKTQGRSPGERGDQDQVEERAEAPLLQQRLEYRQEQLDYMEYQKAQEAFDLAAEKKPDDQTIRQMLDNVEAVTKSRFYQDPDPVASPIEMFMIRDGREGGETFAELSVREKVQVLWDYTPSYEEHGISFEQMEQVFRNIVLHDKPREQWLDGTGLDGRPPASTPTLRELLEEVRDYLPAAEATPVSSEPPRTLGEVLSEKAGKQEREQQPQPQKERGPERER